MFFDHRSSLLPTTSLLAYSALHFADANLTFFVPRSLVVVVVEVEVGRRLCSSVVAVALFSGLVGIGSADVLSSSGLEVESWSNSEVIGHAGDDPGWLMVLFCRCLGGEVWMTGRQRDFHLGRG
jgi:hypothetical protein